MPDRIVRHGWRFWKIHSQGVLLTLLVFTLVVAIWGWSRASDAQQTLNAQEAAKEQGEKISQVVTCFTAARGRPLLISILRALAARETDPLARIAYDLLIDDYENQPIPGIDGKPTRSKCVVLATRLRVDYRTYDFDPKTGKLLSPVITR